MPFVKDEYALLYVGASYIRDASALVTAATDVMGVLNGKKVTVKKQYRRGMRKVYTAPSTQEEAVQSVEQDGQGEQDDTQEAPPPAPTAQGYRVTPKYPVVVTNELFHNGNVESWKKVIESYKRKFPGTEVLIWYEAERLKDINTLFKWGKVKHGTPIMFSVAGAEIGAVSKLRRYLLEVASPRFEAFLKGAPNQVLNLF